MYTVVACSLLSIVLTWQDYDKLKLSVRIYPEDKILYGDPVFIEFTIVNSGDSNIVHEQPILIDEWIEPTSVYIEDPDIRRSIKLVTYGMPSPLVFNAKSVTKWYRFGYLPSVEDIDRDFWTVKARGRRLILSGDYLIRLRGSVNTTITGPGVSFDLISRDSDEIDELLQLKEREREERQREVDTTLPCLHDLHIQLLKNAHFEILEKYAEEVIRTGGLHDMLHMIAEISFLYNKYIFYQKNPKLLWLPEDMQRRRLYFSWLLQQPDVKRQVLIHESLRLANEYKMNALIGLLGKLQELDKEL